jgi:long-chain fatty acid transport protein
MPRFRTILAAFALLPTLPSVAFAGGFELPGEGGARGLGRAGAFYARVDDPMALSLNPANLADGSGIQIYATGGLVTADGCFQRTGTYADTDNPIGLGPSIFDAMPADSSTWLAYLNESFPRACNQSPLGPALNLAASWRILPELGIGIGILTPNGAGSSQWATDSTRYTTEGGPNPPGILPPPSRYILLEQDQLLLYPSIGIAYRPVPWFRFGATFQWGIGVFDFTSVVVRQPGQDPASDVLAKLHASDAFVPAGIFSAHFVPHDNFDAMLGFKISDNINATGETTLETGTYGAGSDPDIPGPTPNLNAPITNTQVSAGQPWEVRLGLRYAQRITPRAEDPDQISRLSGRTEDAMANEWFDIELDAIYLINKEVTDLALTLPMGSQASFSQVQSGGGVTTMDLNLPTRINLPHQWNDQWLLRLGGDFNAIPGLASLRLGFSFETSAYDSSGVFSNRNAKQYVGLDFIPGMRFGIHAGLTVRISLVDVSLAYAHVFQETIQVTTAEAGLRQVSALTPEAGEITNAGTYTADYNMFQLGLNFHL